MTVKALQTWPGCAFLLSSSQKQTAVPGRQVLLLRVLGLVIDKQEECTNERRSRRVARVISSVCLPLGYRCPVWNPPWRCVLNNGRRTTLDQTATQGSIFPSVSRPPSLSSCDPDLSRLNREGKWNGRQDSSITVLLIQARGQYKRTRMTH